MPYDFNFDLSGIPRQFFRELSRVAEERQLHRRFGLRARDIAERFKLSEATGLDIETILFLMEGNCKASFDSGVPTYRCAHCSKDCQVGQAAKLGEERGYSVFIVPGGSCIPSIIKRGDFKAIVGVACGMEMKPALQMIKKFDLPGQAVPLLKNGCANTAFSIHYLEAIL